MHNNNNAYISLLLLLLIILVAIDVYFMFSIIIINSLKIFFSTKIYLAQYYSTNVQIKVCWTFDQYCFVVCSSRSVQNRPASLRQTLFCWTRVWVYWAFSFMCFCNTACWNLQINLPCWWFKVLNCLLTTCTPLALESN